jgi:hypothetical protein
VGLAFSNIIQMLVFYTWVVRFISESISLFGSVEGVSHWGGNRAQVGLPSYVQRQDPGVVCALHGVLGTRR